MNTKFPSNLVGTTQTADNTSAWVDYEVIA